MNYISLPKDVIANRVIIAEYQMLCRWVRIIIS